MNQPHDPLHSSYFFVCSVFLYLLFFLFELNLITYETFFIKEAQA